MDIFIDCEGIIISQIKMVKIDETPKNNLLRIYPLNARQTTNCINWQFLQQVAKKNRKVILTFQTYSKKSFSPKT